MTTTGGKAHDSKFIVVHLEENGFPEACNGEILKIVSSVSFLFVLQSKTQNFSFGIKLIRFPNVLPKYESHFHFYEIASNFKATLAGYTVWQTRQ